MGAWAVVLEGVALTGGSTAPVSGALGCLSVPPAGLGLPGLRTEDVTFPQRDGVQHFSDWYEPRIITLENVSVCGEGCVSCPSARAKVRDILQAWSRKCEDVEMVIFTDCDDCGPQSGYGDGAYGSGPYGGECSATDRSLNGPFGVVGRPRVAEVTWIGRGNSCALLTLRFDAVDHRMFILDAAGNPGSGTKCVTLTPLVASYCRTYNRCYNDPCGGFRYSTNIGAPGSGPQDAVVEGTLCANPIIMTLAGSLTNPFIENLTTGDYIGYNGTILASDPPVIINTETGTATQGGASRTHLLTGNPLFRLEPGSNILRLSSFGATDVGGVDVCWRDAVGSA